MDIFRFGFSFWKKRLPLAALCQLMGFIALSLGIYLPLFGKYIIDYVLNYNGQPPSETGPTAFLLSGSFGEIGSSKLFVSIAVSFAVFVLAKIILLYIRNNLFQRNGLKLEEELRALLYKKLLTLNDVVLKDQNTGDLLTMLNSDVIIFKDLYAANILSVSDSVFLIIFASYLLSSLNPLFLVIPVIMAPPLIVTFKKFIKGAREISLKIRASNAQISMAVQENINAVRLVRSFTNEQYEMQKFDRANADFMKNYFAHTDYMAKYGVRFGVIRHLAYIISIGLAAYLILSGKMLVGSLAACAWYVMYIMDLIAGLNHQVFTFQQQLVSGGRIMSFLNLQNPVTEPSQPAAADKSRCDIKIENAGYKAGGVEILKDINIDIPQGKKLGIMGKTGSGKTMLVKALSRMFDLSGGTVTINGTDIKLYSLSDLREYFAYVFQDVFLFSNTVKYNITFANKDADFSQVQKAAKISCSEEFITGLSEGCDTIIGERGVGLSGGQKQRLSIARALLKDSPVLILDDCSSALDMITEKKVLKGIKREYPGKTLIIIAHRAESVKDCDEIIYLENGEIAERGTFRQLLRQDGRFAAVYRDQKTSAQNEEEQLAEQQG